MSISIRSRCSVAVGFFAFCCLQSIAAKADFLSLSEVHAEVRGGYYLRDSYHLSMRSEQVQRVLQLFQYSTPGWTLLTHTPELEGDVTRFGFTLRPSLASSDEETESQGPKENRDDECEFFERYDKDAALHLLGWTGYWSKAKGMVSSAKNFACSAAQAVSQYATHVFSTRTLAGSITQEPIQCPAPYASEGTRLLFSLEDSDPFISSVLSQFAIRVCHDEANWDQEQRIKVHMRIEVKPGMAYSSLVDSELAALKSEDFARAWLRSVQAVVDENEVKLVHDKWADAE